MIYQQLLNLYFVVANDYPQVLLLIQARKINFWIIFYIYAKK